MIGNKLLPLILLDNRCINFFRFFICCRIVNSFKSLHTIGNYFISESFHFSWYSLLSCRSTYQLAHFHPYILSNDGMSCFFLLPRFLYMIRVVKKKTNLSNISVRSYSYWFGFIDVWFHNWLRISYIDHPLNTNYVYCCRHYKCTRLHRYRVPVLHTRYDTIFYTFHRKSRTLRSDCFPNCILDKSKCPMCHQCLGLLLIQTADFLHSYLLK